MNLIKAHAYGNDFLLAPAADVPAGADLARLARLACERHRGVGADGLIVVTERPDGAAVDIWNADGSRPEVSGNGVRCVAAWLADRRRLTAGGALVIETRAGAKRLTLVARTGEGAVFRAAMGAPRDIRRRTLDVAGTPVDIVTLNVGNPQCVVLGPATTERLAWLGPALATHPAFPEGTNVELAALDASDRVRILIWERGVGPTESSGTGHLCGGGRRGILWRRRQDARCRRAWGRAARGMDG